MSKVKTIFKEFKNVDAILVSSKANKFYLKARYSSRGYVLLIRSGLKAVYFIDYRSILEFDDSFDKVVLNKDDNPISVISNYINKLNIQTLGLEGDYLTYKQFIEISENLNNINSLPINIDKIREIKSVEEINKIRQACKIADKSYLDLLKVIKIGMSEKEVASKLNVLLIENGGDQLAFETIVLSGVNGALPHGKPSNKIIEFGDFITIDYGVKYKGYCSDTTRTFVMGEILNPEMKIIYEAVLKAHKTAATFIVENTLMCEADKSSRDVLENLGYGKYFSHHLGHSIGIEAHESPRLAQGVNKLIIANMVFTNEPGVYIDGLGGVRIEDTFIVTPSGYESLNKTSKELIIVEV